MTRYKKKIKIDVSPFDYDDENKTSYSRFHHTEGFVHHKSLSIKLHVVKTHPEIAHVSKPSCFFTLILVSRDCNCYLKIVTVGLTHGEKNLNLNLFDFCVFTDRLYVKP